MSPTARIHPLYCLLFLTLEPLTALAGAVCAYFVPAYYLNTTYPSSPFNFLPSRLPPSVSIAVQQLANLYLLFAINEVVVLRFAARQNPAAPRWYYTFGMEWSHVDLLVWQALLGGLLIADAGHLWSVRSLGAETYWRVDTWNAMAWGNIGVVYVGALTRVLFLAGVGVERVQGEGMAKRKKR